ncbi:MAG TPA: hypothetical protein VED01_21910 [Burkholderiales bacterium]|nr:hypothetical protein [Burkholderiales bacterium]
MERRRQWNFLLGDDGSWMWRVFDPAGTEERSEKSFATLKECTEDAARNGYVAWRTEEERRRKS